MKQGIQIIFLLALASTLLTTNAQTAVVDRIVALVDQYAITQSDLEEKLQALQNSGFSGPGSMREKALDSLIEEKILALEIERENLQPSDEEVEQAVRVQFRAFSIPLEELKAQLKNKGTSFDEAKIEASKKIQKDKLIQKKILPKIHISEMDMQDYYLKNKPEFIGYQKVRFFEILLTPEVVSQGKDYAEFVREILTKLHQGSDFQAVAKQYSRGAFSANSGDSGLIDVTTMRPEISDVIQNAKLGQITGPIPAPNNGIFLFKLIEQKDPKVRPFNEIKELIRMKIGDSMVQDELQNYLMMARAKHFVEIKSP